MIFDKYSPKNPTRSVEIERYHEILDYYKKNPNRLESNISKLKDMYPEIKRIRKDMMKEASKLKKDISKNMEESWENLNSLESKLNYLLSLENK